MGHFPILSFLLLTVLSAPTDGTSVFNKGTKIGEIVAREEARLSERQAIQCVDNFVYRPIDGICNNLNNPLWGAPLQPMRRLVSPQYHNDQDSPRIYGNLGNLLPSAREVSVACFPADSIATEDRPFSQMVMQWGQLIDHDITGTPGTGASGCCADMGSDGVHPDFANDLPCMPIQVPSGDRQFTSCIEFSRSKPTSQTTATSKREQFNILTSYIDGGFVYGSSQEEMDALRSGSGGLMKTSAGDLLPTSDKNVCLKVDGKSCFDAGDFRINVFPGLASMHTLFVREHNRLVGELASMHTNWDDEKLFQEARKIVVAYVQRITYNVYLRDTLGPSVYNDFGFDGNYVYDDTINPGIYNSFATAAFRHGHSQIAGHYGVKGDSEKDIADLFMNPSYVYDSLDDVMLGVIDTPNQKADDKFSRGVTDHLFENTSKAGVSSDLAALNIQRGRDHGLAPYLDYVTHINDDNNPASNLKLPNCAKGLYDELGDLDLYVGAMAENPLNKAMVGPSFAYIIAKQFQDLRLGDRFWHETTNSTIGFSADQLTEIRKVTLARVICDNTGITSIQPDVFKLPGNGNKNGKVDCSTLPSLDITKWQ